MIVPFPGTPPRTPRLDPAYYRARQAASRRVLWWKAKRWIVVHPWPVAVLWSLLGGALLWFWWLR